MGGNSRQFVNMGVNRNRQRKISDLFMVRVTVIVFGVTLNNIPVISWWSVLLVNYPVKITDLS